PRSVASQLHQRVPTLGCWGHGPTESQNALTLVEGGASQDIGGKAWCDDQANN
ncbi:unnamed protein product, partial [Aphanomyces euteiches]